MIYLVIVEDANGKREVLLAFQSEYLANSERKHLEAVAVPGCYYFVESVELRQ